MILLLAFAASADSPRDVIENPQHPLHDACLNAFGAGGAMLDCIKMTAKRDDGLGEVLACGRLNGANHRRACTDSLPRRRYDAGETIGLCVDLFGPKAVDCMKITGSDPGAPAGEVRACSSIYPKSGDALGCLARFSLNATDLEQSILACKAHLPTLTDKCVNMIVEAPIDKAPLIELCKQRLPNDKAAIKCVSQFLRTPTDVVAGIQLCDTFSERKDHCLDLVARSTGPMQNVLAACKGDEAERIKCASKYAESPHDMGPAVIACGSGTVDYLPECLDRITTADHPMEEIVSACTSTLHEEKAAMICLKSMVEWPGAKADTIVACGELFSDDKYRLQCITLSGSRGPEQVRACSTQPEGKERLRCLGG